MSQHSASHRRARSVVIPICSAVLLCLLGCAGSSSTERGNLSEAMKKASDDNTGSRTVQPGQSSGNSDTSAFWIIGLLFDNDRPANSSQPSMRVPEREDKDSSVQHWCSISAGTGIVSEKAFYGLQHFNIRWGTYQSEQTRLEASAGLGWAPVQQSNTLSHSIDGGVVLLNFGLQFNWYTTPKYTFLGNYFLIGGNYNYMQWHYRNTIYSGSKAIDYDGMNGVEVFGGVGFNLVQTAGFQLGGEVTPGAVFWLGDTEEGFTNDVFSPFTYVKFKVVVNFGI